jgi:hypothetical protein
MCTVTFIPFGNTIFITSNRDESPSRQSKGLTSRHSLDGPAIHYPLDVESNGSWIALADTGRSVCLLNGGFIPFIPDPSYRMSRGQVVMDAAVAPDALTFVENYNLEGIAPFTLLVFEKNNFIQIVWDGFKRHISELPFDQPRLWSSVTLYPPAVREWRNEMFETWMKEREVFDRESIMAFHCLKKGDAGNDFIMNRNEVVKTLSVSSIQLQKHKGSLLHLDLEKSTREEVVIHYD